ncbi:MAG: DUF1294 domain-containing protein [Clostridia bacterium]|nr:DUF1294 domain-containing protein [Clostridia bacterium]
MQWIFEFLLIWFAVVSLAAVIITVADKVFARKGKWRIPEATLMLVGLAGGALAMLITMKVIRHKTLHNKFMLGLPAEIILHIALVIALIYFTK